VTSRAGEPNIPPTEARLAEVAGLLAEAILRLRARGQGRLGTREKVSRNDLDDLRETRTHGEEVTRCGA
jgi:hypothetical protein